MLNPGKPAGEMLAEFGSICNTALHMATIVSKTDYVVDHAMLGDPGMLHNLHVSMVATMRKERKISVYKMLIVKML